MAKSKLKAVKVPELLIVRLDIGCGKNPKEGFLGVDAIDFGQDVVLDVAAENPEWHRENEQFRKGKLAGEPAQPQYLRWPWADGSVEEVHCSHFLEHLTAPQRIHFANELYRVLKSPARDAAGNVTREGGKATIVVPHFASERAYGDLTHQWPPVVGFWFSYLDKDWRATQAPHNTEYTCDFFTTWGFSLHPLIAPRNQEYQMHALTFWKEAAQDMIATMAKK